MSATAARSPVSEPLSHETPAGDPLDAKPNFKCNEDSDVGVGRSMATEVQHEAVGNGDLENIKLGVTARVRNGDSRTSEWPQTPKGLDSRGTDAPETRLCLISCPVETATVSANGAIRTPQSVEASALFSPVRQNAKWRGLAASYAPISCRRNKQRAYNSNGSAGGAASGGSAPFNNSCRQEGAGRGRRTNYRQLAGPSAFENGKRSDTRRAQKWENSPEVPTKGNLNRFDAVHSSLRWGDGREDASRRSPGKETANQSHEVGHLSDGLKQEPATSDQRGSADVINGSNSYLHGRSEDLSTAPTVTSPVAAEELTSREGSWGSSSSAASPAVPGVPDEAVVLISASAHQSCQEMGERSLGIAEDSMVVQQGTYFHPQHSQLANSERLQRSHCADVNCRYTYSTPELPRYPKAPGFEGSPSSSQRLEKGSHNMFSRNSRDWYWDAEPVAQSPHNGGDCSGRGYDASDSTSVLEGNLERTSECSGCRPKKKQFYKTKLCPWFERKRCDRGSECYYAHSRRELRPLPDLSRTRMCEEHLRLGECSRGVNCRFAHGVRELRATQAYFKTRLCLFFKKGHCAAGHTCRHAHGRAELTRYQEAASGAQAPSGPDSQGECSSADDCSRMDAAGGARRYYDRPVCESCAARAKIGRGQGALSPSFGVEPPENGRDADVSYSEALFDGSSDLFHSQPPWTRAEQQLVDSYRIADVSGAESNHQSLQHPQGPESGGSFQDTVVGGECPAHPLRSPCHAQSGQTSCRQYTDSGLAAESPPCLIQQPVGFTLQPQFDPSKANSEGMHSNVLLGQQQPNGLGRVPAPLLMQTSVCALKPASSVYGGPTFCSQSIEAIPPGAKAELRTPTSGGGVATTCATKLVKQSVNSSACFACSTALPQLTATAPTVIGPALAHAGKIVSSAPPAAFQPVAQSVPFPRAPYQPLVGNLMKTVDYWDAGGASTSVSGPLKVSERTSSSSGADEEPRASVARVEVTQQQTCPFILNLSYMKPPSTAGIAEGDPRFMFALGSFSAEDLAAAQPELYED